jgi:hypothetical protein
MGHGQDLDDRKKCYNSAHNIKLNWHRTVKCTGSLCNELLVGPITLDRSTAKVLCPLNNVTMLDYSIEFLAGAGVEEIFVFCVHGADEVERYVLQSTWSSVLQVHCVKDSTCANPGDALRELVRFTPSYVKFQCFPSVLRFINI